ncbi:MAG: cysteine desulfurase [Flavobacteriales bacterium]|jgi:cysteine desulfurase|nr:cysteine desulfurase [Flavobacteriales bacterium]
MKRQVIYLDNNATTPIDPRVLEAMMPYLTYEFANANSTHQFGLNAYDAVKTARKQVAELIGAETNEIIFTSGATEAINLAIKGVAEQYADNGKHIVTVATEHSAVLDTCKYLETKGYEVTYLPVERDGLLDKEVVKNRLRDDTILLAVMYANNETGVLQPIQELAAMAHEAGALFMTDATQAVGKLRIDVQELNVDLLCMSGHKFYAPKGIGALYVRQRGRRLKLPALLHGGGHERGLRSGTLNVPGIVSLGKACELALKEMPANEKHIRTLRDRLEAELLEIEGASVNGSTTHRLYNTSNILLEGVDSDALILGLSNSESDEPIIAISNGSACTSANIEPSHVLTSMGLDDLAAFSCIRISLGTPNHDHELTTVSGSVSKLVNNLRSMIIR